MQKIPARSIVVALSVVLLCLLGPTPLRLTVQFLPVGWALYLARVSPNVRVDSGGVLTWLICVTLFTVGLHLFLRWFYRELHVPTRATQWSMRWTLSLVAVVVLMFVAGIAAVGITHQTSWLMTSRRPWVEDRALETTPSHIKLTTIGLGVTNYFHAEQRESLNPISAQSQRFHSWQTLILGYLPVRSDNIDFDRPWDDPHNAPSFRAFVPAYLNPEIPILRTRNGYAVSHYAGNNRAFDPSRAGYLVAAPDGMANTILAGEAATDLRAWGDPSNLRDPALGVNSVSQGFGNPVHDGVQFLMMDGSVRFVRAEVDPKILRALATPTGGEKGSLEAGRLN
jgi:hypothetical protein